MKDKIKRARLIYNPTSGQEIIKKNIAEVLDVLEDVGYETSAYQTTPAPLSAQKEAEKILQYLIQEELIPGASITVTKQGKTIWQGGYGYARLSRQAK